MKRQRQTTPGTPLLSRQSIPSDAPSRTSIMISLRPNASSRASIREVFAGNASSRTRPDAEAIGRDAASWTTTDVGDAVSRCAIGFFMNGTPDRGLRRGNTGTRASVRVWDETISGTAVIIGEVETRTVRVIIVCDDAVTWTSARVWH